MNDIFDALEHHNFANEHQIELLNIIKYILIRKRYPIDIDELINRKIELLKISSEFPESENSKETNLKPRMAALVEILDELGIGPKHNDMKTVSKMISLFTGYSEKNIYNILQKGFYLSRKYHFQQVENFNAMFKKLKSTISINMTKLY